MATEAKRFEDAEFAAQFFADAGDANAAQRKLSEDGAQINLMNVVISLSKEVQKLRGVGTEKHDEELLADKNTPASQRDAIQRGVDNKESAATSEAKAESSAKEDSKTPSSNLPNASQPSSDIPPAPTTSSSSVAPANSSSPENSAKTEHQQKSSDLSTSLNIPV